MARRSIMNEGAQNDTNDDPNENGDANETKERIQTTLRLPSDLADDLDDWADMRGMSRNAAVTYFIAEGLNSD